jgi:tetratricopeptide (TPR) repeat protein
MPRATANDIAHEQVTDHSIPRVPGTVGKSVSSSSVAGRLVAVGSKAGVPGDTSDRDLGLAYALAASRGDRAAGETAFGLLKRAELQPGAEEDAQMHEQLGFLEQMSGDGAAAAREYGLALAADSHDAVAAGNLALLKVRNREYEEAISLLERSFDEDPVELKAGMNLALVECGVGRKEAALGVLERILEFSPDDGAARELARGIRTGSHGCGAGGRGAK